MNQGTTVNPTVNPTVYPTIEHTLNPTLQIKSSENTSSTSISTTTILIIGFATGFATACIILSILYRILLHRRKNQHTNEDIIKSIISDHQPSIAIKTNANANANINLQMGNRTTVNKYNRNIIPAAAYPSMGTDSDVSLGCIIDHDLTDVMPTAITVFKPYNTSDALLNSFICKETNGSQTHSLPSQISCITGISLFGSENNSIFDSLPKVLHSEICTKVSETNSTNSESDSETFLEITFDSYGEKKVKQQKVTFSEEINFDGITKDDESKLEVDGEVNGSGSEKSEKQVEREVNVEDIDDEESVDDSESGEEYEHNRDYTMSYIEMIVMSGKVSETSKEYI